MKNVMFLLFTILLTVLILADRPRGVHGHSLAAPAAAGQIRFQQSSANVAENAAAVDITIERVNGSDSQPSATAVTILDDETARFVYLPAVQR